MERVHGIGSFAVFGLSMFSRDFPCQNRSIRRNRFSPQGGGNAIYERRQLGPTTTLFAVSYVWLAMIVPRLFASSRMLDAPMPRG